MRLIYFGLLIFLVYKPVSTSAQTYFQENFERGTGTALPAGWTQVTKAEDGGWLRGYGSTITSYSFAPPLHSQVLATNDNKCECNKKNDFLETPAIDISHSIHPWLTFDYFTNTIYRDDSLKVSIDEGNTWKTIWVDTAVNDYTEDYAWHTIGFDLSNYSGTGNLRVGFKYSDKGITAFGWAIDNVRVYERQNNELLFEALSPKTFEPDAFGKIGDTLHIKATVFNAGFDTINDFTFTYSDEENTYRSSFTQIHLPPFERAILRHPVAYSVTSLGTHSLKSWINISDSANKENDSLTTLITGVPSFPDHKTVVEEATGTWCGYCVSGIVYLDSIARQYPQNIIPIAVHDGDPMEDSSYDNPESSFPGFIGFPSMVWNRCNIGEPDTLFDFYQQHEHDFGYADLEVVADYDIRSNSITINIQLKPAIDLIGDYRIATIFTEDSIRGSNNYYDQRNFYASADSLDLGPMGGFENLPDPIPYDQMIYNHVAHQINSSYFGDRGDLPDTLKAGSNYQQTFNYPIAVSWHPENLKVIAILLDGATDKILNANFSALSQVTSSNGVLSQNQVSVYPNPANETCTIDISALNNVHGSIECCDAMGRQIARIFSGELKAGKNLINFNTAGIPSGIYEVNIRMSSFVQKKLVVVH